MNRYLSLLLLSAMVSNQAMAAAGDVTDQINQALSKENLQKSLGEIQNQAYVDRLEKEVNLYYLRILKEDLQFAKSSKQTIQNIDSEGLRTAAELGGIVIPISAEAYLAFKVMQRTIKAVPNAFNSARFAFADSAYSQDLVSISKSGVVTKTELVPVRTSAINYFKIPEGMVRSGWTFGKTLIGASVGVATVGTLLVLTYQGSKALVMSDDTFNVLIKDTDAKINKLSQEIAAAILESAAK